MPGFTQQEKFLNSLGKISFLQYWSWPSLFRDQGDSHKNGDGKEICDLTVVFGNDVILFSDKKVKFNQDINVETAWSRWAREAIGKSVKQIKGARRWFQNYPERIFTDKGCTKKIPISIPSKEKIKFHNVVVCHGIEDALLNFNNEASFTLDNSIIDELHWRGENITPFCIGQIFEHDFVHIFNESTIELVLREFDTTKDFIQYLYKREELLSSDKRIRVFSESDIVQLYYENFDEKKGERSIWPKEVLHAESIDIDMGGIHRLYTNPYFIAKKTQDKISYFWDDFINNFSISILNGTVEHTNWENPREFEPSLRYLASANRFERRVLASSFKEFYEKIPPGNRGTRLYFNPSDRRNAYLFLALPFENAFKSRDRYSDVRRTLLADYCAINKFLEKDIVNIFGIAFETRNNDEILAPNFFENSQDFVFLDGNYWEESDYLEAEKTYC